MIVPKVASLLLFVLLLAAPSRDGFAEDDVVSEDDVVAEDSPSPVANHYATPEAAAEALASAFEKNDDGMLRAVLGKGSEDLVEDGADPRVVQTRKRIASQLREGVRAEVQEGRGTVLLVGSTAWPFPIPLRSVGSSWAFDVPAGRAEVLARRVGRNELEAIGVCRSYIEMQIAYASEDRDGDEVREYAQRVLSSAGQRNGLYWPDPQGAEPAPLGVPLVPLNNASQGGKRPYSGYYWRILRGQGPSAPGGAHSYLVNGNMIAGCALVAVPAKYRESGVMTFLVSHHGKLFQRDLGPQSLDLVRAMNSYEPDAGWAEVSAETPAAQSASPAVAPTKVDVDDDEEEEDEEEE